MRAALPKMDNAGGSEPCGKGTCQVCDHLITRNTFTTKVCGEVFKIQSGPLNCNSEKVLYLLRCKICHDTPYLQLIIVKVNTDLFEKENRTYHRSVFIHYIQDCHWCIDDWEVSLFWEVWNPQTTERKGDVFATQIKKHFTHLA